MSTPNTLLKVGARYGNDLPLPQPKSIAVLVDDACFFYVAWKLFEFIAGIYVKDFSIVFGSQFFPNGLFRSWLVVGP
jgi:hypothetical protein